MKSVINRIWVLVFVSIVFTACKKSLLSPVCWGEKKEGIFYYDWCANVGYIALYNGDSLQATDGIPKYFRKRENISGVNVKVKYTDGEPYGGVLTACFGFPFTKSIKIKCMQEND